jgi:hypothetical protein
MLLSGESNRPAVSQTRSVVPTFKKAPPQSNPSPCSAERHLWPYGLSLAIYVRIGTLTAGGKNSFYGKTKTLAKYFGANAEAARRAFKRLVNAGWLQPLTEKGHYKYINHDDRAFIKADCVAVEELPHWAAEADPFAGKIHGASGGKIRLLPNWLAAARKHCTEEEFLTALRKEFENGHGSPGTRFWNAVRQFRARRSTVENPTSK